MGRGMKFLNCIIYLICGFVFCGFDPQTTVKVENGYKRFNELNLGDRIVTYDCVLGENTISRIVGKQFNEVIGYAQLVCKNELIIASLDQMFYLPILREWKRASELQINDLFLSMDGSYIPVLEIYFSEDRINICEIEVEDTHTLFIGNAGILSHNAPAIAVVLAAEAAPIIVEAATAIGTALITFYGSKLLKKAVDPKNKKPTIETGKQDAQAPGMPTEADGFEPPKKWDGEKVKAPNGRGYGWPDNKGNIWVPSGPNGHGGPHWDVQKPNGRHDNVLPGGQIRGKKK